MVALSFCVSSLLTADAVAQTPPSPWNAEVSVGWDIGLSGDFLSAGIGTLNDLPVVFQSQPFDDVYGNGVMWQFGGGYMLDDINEVRAQVSYEHVSADVVNLGTAGAFGLVATFADYDAWSIDTTLLRAANACVRMAARQSAFRSLARSTAYWHPRRLDSRATPRISTMARPRSRSASMAARSMRSMSAST
jgi:hypothetical protein